MQLEKLSIHAFINNNAILTESGNPLDFKVHRYLFDIYSDTSKLLVCTKAGQIGFCLDPNTKILTADYKWVALDDVKVGQNVISVDESAKGLRHGRRMRLGVVEEKKEIIETAYRLTMADGRTLVATGKHRFLTQLRSCTTTHWRMVENMEVGDTIRHFCQVWDDGNYEDGWVGGALDGEASLRSKTGSELTFVQLPDKGVLERMRNYLIKNGYSFREGTRRRSGFNKNPNPIGEITLSRTDDIFRIIKIDWCKSFCH